jgi:hypothetical protein
MLNTVNNLLDFFYFILEILTFGQTIMCEHSLLSFRQIFRFLSFIWWFAIIRRCFLILHFWRWRLRRVIRLSLLKLRLLRTQLVNSVTFQRFFGSFHLIISKWLVLRVEWLYLNNFILGRWIEFNGAQIT